MDRRTEIVFMQTRIARLAMENWHEPIDKVIEIFKNADVFGYIEKMLRNLPL